MKAEHDPGMIEAGFTISEAAAAVGVSQTTVWRTRKDAQRSEGISGLEAAMREILARTPDITPGEMHARLSARQIFVPRREIVRTMQALEAAQS